MSWEIVKVSYKIFMTLKIYKLTETNFLGRKNPQDITIYKCNIEFTDETFYTIYCFKSV